MPIYVDDSSDLTVTSIRAKCRRLARKQGIALVVVDYLQLMQGPGISETRQQEIADISRSLKNLARELRIPIIAVSQLNRALEQRENKRPRLGDLRESGAIEQDADIVIFIYRDEYYNPPDQPGLAEINIAKHRSGAVGTVMMNFAAEFTRFRNYTSDEPI
jgi:replicative DNA helicase